MHPGKSHIQSKSKYLIDKEKSFQANIYKNYLNAQHMKMK